MSVSVKEDTLELDEDEIKLVIEALDDKIKALQKSSSASATIGPAYFNTAMNIGDRWRVFGKLLYKFKQVE